MWPNDLLLFSHRDQKRAEFMRVNLMGMEANPHPCMWICFRIQVYFNAIAHATLYKSNNSNMFLRSVCFYFYYKPHSAFSVMVKPLHCLEYFNLWVCSVAKKKKSPFPALTPQHNLFIKFRVPLDLPQDISNNSYNNDLKWKTLRSFIVLGCGSVPPAGASLSEYLWRECSIRHITP